MSLQSDISRITYAGNGSTVTPYVVPFVFFENSHLQAVARTTAGVETDIALTGHTGAGNPNGGTVRTATAVPATSTLTIYRVVPETQTTSYMEGGDFPAASHERALDKLTMIAQQIGRNIRSALRFRESDGLLAEIAKVNNTLLGVGAGGSPVCRTADDVKSWLSLAAPILNYPTKTWADDAERAIAVPDFVGQLGSQRDTGGIYASSSLSAGAWTELQSNLPDGYLSADSGGRAKMADGYLTLAKIAAGIFTADADGRGKFAAGFLTDTLLAAALDLSGKTLTMPATHFADIAPAGAVLQTLQQKVTTGVTINTVIANGPSVTPTIADGTEIFSQTITPASASNKVLVTANLLITTNGYTPTVALFRGSTCLGAWSAIGAADYPTSCAISFLDSPATAGPVTYSIRGGNDMAPTYVLYINRNSSVNPLYAKVASTMTVQEIKG